MPPAPAPCTRRRLRASPGGAAPHSRLPAGAWPGAAAVPAPARDGAEPARMARGRGASPCPRPCRSRGVASSHLCHSDSRCPEFSTPHPGPASASLAASVPERQHAKGRGGPAGMSPRWTGLLSTAWDQRGQAEHSRRAACVWPACAGGFLNESANGHGAEGARNCSNSRARGRSTPGTVRARMQPP